MSKGWQELHVHTVDGKRFEYVMEAESTPRINIERFLFWLNQNGGLWIESNTGKITYVKADAIAWVETHGSVRSKP